MGTLITFEGLDGSGKSTQLRLAAEWLGRRGIEPLVTHEPGGTPLGETLRELVLRGRGTPPADAVVELLLIVASRRQHLIEVVRPALAAGRVVLCDRFSDSSLAYQGAGRGLERGLVEAVDAFATEGLKPDLTLLFDLDPAESRRRRLGAARGDEGEDRLERQALEFHQRVRAGFLDIARAEPQRLVVFDANETPERIAGLVAELLAARLCLSAEGVA